MMAKKVTVIGAGFAGLTLARELLKRELEVEVIEKSARAGGMLGTEVTPYGLAETAAPSLLRTGKVDALFRELGVPVLEPSPASKKRLFFSRGLRRWPVGVFATLRMALLFVRAKLTGTLKPRPRETVADWGRRNLGEAAVRELLGPALQGIFAADHRQLSASLVLGPMFRRGKKEPYRGVIGAEEGTARLVRALEEDVRARGGNIRFNTPATDRHLRAPVALAVPAPAASALLQEGHPVLAKRIAAVRQAPLVTMTAFYGERTGPAAFGCLIGRDRGLRVLGVLLNHEIFPQRNESCSEAWIFGGAADPGIVDLSDAEMRSLQAGERQKLFGKTDAPLDVRLTRWREGLPVYDAVLEDLLTDLREPAGIWLHGNWLGGIGLSKILERSEILADRIARELK